MSTSRRQILKSGLVAGASLISGVKAKLAVAGGSCSEMLTHRNVAELDLVPQSFNTRQKFNTLIGDVFYVDMGPADSALPLHLQKLIDVDADTYIVVFTTRDGRRLAQDTYTINHPTIESMPVFMGPNPITQTEHLEGFIKGGKQKTPKRFYYEAVFNHRGQNIS